MMCEYCEYRKPILGGDGCFIVSRMALRRRDGTIEEQPIIEYTARDSVFSYKIAIEDYSVINNCPMCGRKLVGDAS